MLRLLKGKFYKRKNPVAFYAVVLAEDTAKEVETLLESGIAYHQERGDTRRVLLLKEALYGLQNKTNVKKVK